MNKELENLELEALASQYFDIEATILKRIEKLSEYGKECKCNEPTRFAIVDDNFAMAYCLNCGGNIDW